MICAGCDLGTVSAKVVIVEDETILAVAIDEYDNLPQQAAVEVMEKALAHAGLSEGQIEYCFSTGMGKEAVAYSDDNVPEDSCLHRAVTQLNPDIKTVVEVGGHTLRVFNIGNSRKISEIAVTNKCATGTGKFLDVMATALEMSVDKLSEEALNSNHSVPITSQCIVFAESEVVSHVNEGKDKIEIFAGIASSVADRISGLVRRVSINEDVIFIGGVAKNSIVFRDLEKNLGVKLAGNCGVDPQAFGAYGAALMAFDAGATR